ncbi:MAG: oligosaccharide flippase family protein [Pseudomonadota bacterium]
MSTTAASIRSRNIVRTAWTGLAAKLIAIGISLLMVPMGIHYLGKDEYGLWVAASSLIAMLGFMDGGAGNVAINMVAYAKGEDPAKLRQIVSTLFFSVMLFALLGWMLFAGIWPLMPWERLIGGASNQAGIPNLILIIGTFFFISMVVTLVGKVQRGMQDGYLENLWNALGSVLTLVLLYSVIQMNWGLQSFAVVLLLGPLMAAMLSNLHYWYYYKPDIRPSIAMVDLELAKGAIRTGAMFFVLQIATLIQGEVDNVLIANILGASSVTSYAVCMKLFLIFPMFLGLLLAPLWPAYREALSSGDILWIKRIFFKSMKIACFTSIPVAILLSVWGREIIHAWVGEDLTPSDLLLAGCAIWMFCCSVGTALAMFFNGMQFIKIQVIAAISSSVLNVFFSVYLIHRIGVAGAVWGSVIGWLSGTLIPYLFILRHTFRNESWLRHGL